MNEKNNYRTLIDAVPDPILIIQNSKIVLSNAAADRIIPNIQSKDISELLKSDTDKAHKRITEVLHTRNSNTPTTYTLELNSGLKLWFEMQSHYIEWNGSPATLTYARDITEKQHLLNQANLLKQWMMLKHIPIWKNALVKTSYFPKCELSSDFYLTETIGTDAFVVFIGCIPRKQLNAIMMLSALDVIFRDFVRLDMTFKEKLNWFNDRIRLYFPNETVPGQILMWDAVKKRVEICSSGYSGIFWYDLNGDRHDAPSKNPPFGTHTTTTCETMVLSQQIARFIVATSEPYTARLTEHFHSEFPSDLSLYDLSHALSTSIRNQNPLEESGLTAFMLDLHFSGVLKQYILHGLDSYESKVDSILTEMNRKEDFGLRLILTELLTNAFKYGNDRDVDLPIFVQIGCNHNCAIIEVKDMGLHSKQFTIKSQIDLDDILNEGGRGLFLVRQFSDKIFMDNNSIAVKVTF